MASTKVYKGCEVSSFLIDLQSIPPKHSSKVQTIYKPYTNRLYFLAVFTTPINLSTGWAALFNSISVPILTIHLSESQT